MLLNQNYTKPLRKLEPCGFHPKKCLLETLNSEDESRNNFEAPKNFKGDQLKVNQNFSKTAPSTQQNWTNYTPKS